MSNQTGKWYQQTTGIIILLLVFFPVGLYFMWRYANWNILLKTGVSVLLILAFIGLISSSSSTTISNPKPVIKQTIVKKPTQTVTSTPSPSNSQGSSLCDVATMDGTEFDRCLRLHYPLPAKVTTNGVSIFVTNPQTVDWTGCSIKTDDGNYEMNGYDSFNVSAGTTTAEGWGRLTDENGNRLNYLQKQPGPIDISCFIGKQMYEGQFQGF